MQGMINPIYQLASGGLPERAYDPEKAKQILKAAGYSEPIEFTVIFSSAVPDLQEVFIQMQTYAAAGWLQYEGQRRPAGGGCSGVPTRHFRSQHSARYGNRSIAALRAHAAAWKRDRRIIAASGKTRNTTQQRWMRASKPGTPYRPKPPSIGTRRQRIWRDNVPYITLMTVKPPHGL